MENLDDLELKSRRRCYKYLCGAGVDFSIIRSLHESLSAVTPFAAGGGLGWAARGGHLDIVEAFIRTLGADINADDDESGSTALMRAAERSHTDIVNALAGAFNANVEATDKDGMTALRIAGEAGHADTADRFN